MNMKLVVHNLKEPRRGGFTLIELLVVITIVLLIFSITVYAVNFNADAERVRGSANQIQSFLAGALDRAIFEQESVGVRLFLDNTDFRDETGNQIAGNRRTVSALAYIQPSPSWNQGTIILERADLDDDNTIDAVGPDINGDGVANDDPNQVWIAEGTDTGWWELKRRGLLKDDLRIRIPSGAQGTWYPINTALIDVTNYTTGIEKLILQIPYGQTPTVSTPSVQAFGSRNTYDLELPASIVPTDIRLLAEGVVIDLDGSKVPASWGPSPTATTGESEYSQFMDVVFSPRGTLTGTAASEGLIHLYVCDGTDSIRLKEHFSLLDNPGQITPNLTGFRNWLDSQGTASEFDQLIPADVLSLDGPNDFPVRDRRIVSIFAQTGAITVSRVDPTDSNSNGLADDPYLFAEVGSESN